METAQRIAAVRTRLRTMQIDERLTETNGEPCTKCIHFKRGERGYGSAIGGKNIDHCRHLVNTTRHFDPIEKRYIEASHISALEARSETGLCGPEGILFDPGKKIMPRWADWIMGGTGIAVISLSLLADFLN